MKIEERKSGATPKVEFSGLAGKDGEVTVSLLLPLTDAGKVSQKGNITRSYGILKFRIGGREFKITASLLELVGGENLPEVRIV